MKNRDKIIQTAVTAFLILTATPSIATDAANQNQSSVKCYGVVKAGMNDCATATASCAGSATKDGQADAFIFLPQGVCEKLVGGHLAADSDKKS